jgi:ribosomal protein L32
MQETVTVLAECAICGHRWVAGFEDVEYVEHDGEASPVFPDRVECPSCGAWSQALEDV